MAWSHAFKSLLSSATTMSMVGGVMATGVYVVYTDMARDMNMMRAYSRGRILPPLAQNDYEVCYHDREGLELQVREILRPTFENEFFLINGDVGVGKSRLVLEVVRELIETEGKARNGAPIYVLSNQGRSFPETLAQAVDFNFDEHVNFKFFLSFAMRIHSMPKQDSNSRLIRVLEAIERSAFAYMNRTGRPVVLVIDGVNCLPGLQPGALEKLLEKAKLWADANAVKVVFINNDEGTEAKIQANASNWSRMAPPLIVEDMTREESLAFLTAAQFMETEPAVAKEQLGMGIIHRANPRKEKTHWVNTYLDKTYPDNIRMDKSRVDKARLGKAHLDKTNVDKTHSSDNPHMEINRLGNSGVDSAQSNNTRLHHRLSSVMPAVTAERIYNLVGGRMQTLIRFKRDWLNGVPFEETEEELLDREQEKFFAVRTQNPKAWRVVKLLKSAPGMTMLLGRLAKETSLEEVYSLAKENLIRYDREKDGIVVRFRSRLTENAMKSLDD